MKTRMRRFWISVSLAAGSLAFPLSGWLSAHDLPTRWTSGANSNPSWNYLVDDCLDMPMLPATPSLADVESKDRRGTEDWASSCPTELAAGSGIAKRPIDIEADQLFRNPISRFSKEMTCWVNEWQMIQHAARPMALGKVAASQPVWAAYPEAGNPPAPDYSVDHMSGYQPEIVADTCAFDAEHRARQTAAELLAKEIARAAEIAQYEARLSQTIADAHQVAELVAADALPDDQAAGELDALASSDTESKYAAASDITSEVANDQATAAVTAVATDRSEPQDAYPLCGGADQEILSARCFPNRFAPGIVDEYIAYDLDARDQHWLGGLGKSWKLRSALGAAPVSKPADIPADEPGAIVADVSDDVEDVVADEVDAWAVPEEELVGAPESFVAPDRVSEPAVSEQSVAEAITNVEEIVADAVAADIAQSDLAQQSVHSDAELRAYLDRLVQNAQQRALSLLSAAAESASENVPSASSVAEVTREMMAEALPNANDDSPLSPSHFSSFLAQAIEWVELQECRLASEMCGHDSSYRLGEWIAGQSLTVSQITIDGLIELGHRLNVPAQDSDSHSGLDVYVIYVDADGNSLAVPSSLARAWNRPEAESMDQVAIAAQPATETFDWTLLDMVGTQAVAMLANQLDSLGMRLLQASDFLSSWADTQIASREDSSVR